MLTILMENDNHEAELAQTLSALVAGAVEGLVSDVIILDHGSQDGSIRVADAAGARFLTEWEMKDVISSARGEWLLLLEPGARPVGRWIDDIAEYLALAKAPARFSPSRLHRRPFLRRLIARRPSLELGLLMARRHALELAKPGMRLEGFARAQSVRSLPCELVPAWVAIGNRMMRNKP